MSDPNKINSIQSIGRLLREQQNLKIKFLKLAPIYDYVTKDYVDQNSLRYNEDWDKPHWVLYRDNWISFDKKPSSRYMYSGTEIIRQEPNGVYAWVKSRDHEKQGTFLTETETKEMVFIILKSSPGQGWR